MTSQITNREFLIQKRDNFVKFCSEALNKNKKDQRFNKFNDKLSQLKSLNIELFITAVIETMLPYKAEPVKYVLKALGENGLTAADLTSEELNKCARYVQCFIEVVSS